MNFSSVAFFDVDETLIREKSMFSVLTELEAIDSTLKKRNIQQVIKRMTQAGSSREEVNRYFYSCFENLSQSTLRKVAKKYFSNKIQTKNLFNEPVLKILYGLKSIDVKIALLSGSSEDFLHPIAEFLNVDFVFATKQETDLAGFYTGEILNDLPMIGIGKTKAVQIFLKEHNLDAERCFGFGDHYSDLGFLCLVGTPFVVCGDKSMETIALEKKWPLITNINLPSKRC